MSDHVHRNMSLVPYVPQESREVVLRHGSAVVVYDQQSRQMSLRDASHSAAVELADCPYCRRPLRGESPETEHGEHAAGPGNEPGFMNPEYFRMLRRSRPGSADSSHPSSPFKQIGHPHEDAFLRPPPGAEFVGSPVSHGISASAFSPNYFKTFFVEEKELGRGGKGVVLLVRHVLDGVSLGHFACKRVPVGDDHEWLEKVLEEVQLLQNLSHQNLVSYRHVWLEDYQITNFGPSVPCAFILQQFCNAGDLHHYVLGGAVASITKEQMKERIRRRSKGQADFLEPKGARKMPLEEIFSFFKDITSGLNHLHTNGYIHRDLKPSNCLLHNIGHRVRVLVSDFGEVQAVNTARKSTGATGTISYCAPEVVRREHPGGAYGNFTTKSDIFSLGMIVYFMCFGRLPYSQADDINEEKEDIDQLREEISAWAGFDDELKARSDLPDKLYRFLKRLLSLDPAERPGTEEILRGIGAASGLEEINGFPPSVADEIRPRISRVDTPLPSPTKQAHARRHSARPGGIIAGPSKLSPPAPDGGPPPSSPALASSSETRPSAAESSSLIIRPRKTESSLSPRASRSPTPRLILPPPQSPRIRIQQFISDPVVAVSTRLALFLIKVLTLSSPCSPMAANPWVANPLLFLAALDFALMGLARGSAYAGLPTSSVLFGVHLLAVATTLKSGVLCMSTIATWSHA